MDKIEEISEISGIDTTNLSLSNDVIVVIDSSLGSDIAIQEGVCTYTYTKKRYSKQQWYLCKTCNIYCCIICKSKCHKDHEMSEEADSDFFCDCGSDNKNCVALKK